MAINFSEEDKKKLEEDESSIYEKRTDETNKEDIKNLDARGKWKHFRDYYLKGVIVGIIILFLVIVQIYDISHKEKVVLFISIQNDVIDDDKLADMTKKLNKYLKLEEGKETVRISPDSDLHRMQTYLYSGTTDIFICDKKEFTNWGEAGYFFTADKSKEVSFYKDYDEEYRVYSQYISGEDVRNNDLNTDIEPSDPTEYFCALSLKDSKKYKKDLGGVLEEPVAAINFDTKHLDYSRKVLKLLMDNDKGYKD